MNQKWWNYKITKRIWFSIMLDTWIFPFCFRLQCVGNNNRPYNFMVEFLCFQLIFIIDEMAISDAMDEWEETIASSPFFNEDKE